jgi:hypothetical protein
MQRGGDNLSLPSPRIIAHKYMRHAGSLREDQLFLSTGDRLALQTDVHTFLQQSALIKDAPVDLPTMWRALRATCLLLDYQRPVETV